ncbi:SapC family protein [uncultured Paraglaciecola sp.]|uniref:SapC family protein n=1 Tax=uncultured Paraglaciecola sp. TaxID=1765024 RepID=UPI00262EC9C5|nr:SapC family protein [uncultured Paraglaciecola sp.]
MTMNYIPLDKNKHKDLHVKLDANFPHAKEAHLAAASLREYAQIASCMPIIFIKDPNSDTTHSVAMLGIEQGVNLYIQDDKWSGHVVPLNIQRYPFDVRPDGDKLGVFFDENSDLVGTEGEPLFAGDEPSPFFDNRQKLLSELANSEMATRDFVKKIEELGLFDSIVLSAHYVNGQQRNINGMQTISEKRLQALDADTITDLHKTGYLGAIYAVMMSLGQLNRLVQLTQTSDNPVRALQLQLEEPKAEETATEEKPAAKPKAKKTAKK